MQTTFMYNFNVMNKFILIIIDGQCNIIDGFYSELVYDQSCA